MILQQLAEDYEHILQYGVARTDDEEEEEQSLAPPSMYADKLIRGQIELYPDGRFRAYSLLGGAKDKKGKDIGKYLPAPSAVRANNPPPLLLADTPAFVLGLDTDDKNAAKKHEAFKALTKRCAEETGLSGVQAVATFLDWWDVAQEEERNSVLLALNANDTITFSVRGIRLIDEFAVQRFWAKVCGERSKKSGLMQCLICGEHRPAIESMPMMVKGIPGGQTSGTALVSANADVFESYGLKRAATSPICAECAERFGKALNALLKNETTRKRVGGSIYVFWTQKGTFAEPALLGNPNPEYVRSLIESVGDAKQRELDSNLFFGLMLSATAARAVVRDWMVTTVGRVKMNLANWFKMQVDIPNGYGQQGGAVADWVLAACIYRQKTPGKFNSEDVEKRIPPLLMRTALHGEPLPEDLLHRAVLRNRAENKVTYERAVLMTLVLRSRGESHDFARLPKENTDLNPDEEPKRKLDRNSRYAIQCGRLLAVLEELQAAFARSENRKINATLVDRFYSSASSAPGTVFGTLLADAQAHLTKLRKNNIGAYTNLQVQLESEMEGLTEFPLTLNMKQQALFSLGYYHKRAELGVARSEAIEANRRKKADKQSALDLASETNTNASDTEELEIE